MTKTYRYRLLSTSLLASAAIMATPAMAQDATNNQPGTPVHTAPGSPVPGQQVSSPTEGTGPSSDTNQPQTPSGNTNAGSAQQEIVVTGTLIPRKHELGNSIAGHRHLV